MNDDGNANVQDNSFAQYKCLCHLEIKSTNFTKTGSIYQ